jgi:hypothetical protein
MTSIFLNQGLIKHEILVHLSIRHGGRNRMEYEGNKKIKNITSESIT